jgi:6-phosphogluconate dehydrogenase
MKSDLGLVGLGVMGRSLALNLERNGNAVAVFNRTHAKAKALAEDNPDKKFLACATLEDLAKALPRPRRIILMVPAGRSVDDMMEGLAPYLEAGDVLVDGGNSHYTDTERRIGGAATKGFRFLGMGISGGEEGALWGPSLMPGGDRKAYSEWMPVLEKIAAKSDSGPCVTYVGEKGSGHFVKMVHNGIEYGIMQLIAETYDLLRTGLGLDGAALETLFGEWNRAELQSFLIEITEQIVNFPDDRGEGLLLDKILDAAGQKGTGAWTTIAAGELGVPVPTITAAVEARNLSALRGERLRAAGLYPEERRDMAGSGQDLIPAIRAALYAATICAYAQGFALIRTASERFEYDVDVKETARIWKAGCIIRAALLDPIMAAFDRDEELSNLLLDDGFRGLVGERINGLERTVTFAIERKIPAPALSSSLDYFRAYRRERSSAYLIQAQRDLFGAHTYQRTDRDGTFHTIWKKESGN